MVSDEQDPVSGLTPLAVATIEDNADKVRQLLKQGAKVDARSRDRETPLLLAAWKTNYNRAQIIQLLLEKAPPVDATCPKAENNTPLMFVVLKKDLESIRLLRKAGASLTKKNNNGFTATKLAEDTNDKAIILTLTPAKERSALTQLVDLVVGFLLFIITWVNDKAKGVVRQVSRLNPKLDQRLNQDVNGSEQPSNAKFVENVDKIVKDSPLERFFEDKKDYIQDLARKATELENDSTTSLGCKDVLPKTINVSLHQQVIYCDDSSSMKRDRRWIAQEELVKRIVKITTRILPEGEGVALRFINQIVDESPNLTLEDIGNIFYRTSWDPNGDTPIGTFLRSKILQPLVYSKLGKKSLQRPLLISVITDGMPSKENKTEFVDAIVECGRKLQAAGYPRESVKFMVGQIGTAQAATKFLDGIRSNTDIAKVVYVTVERREKLDVKFADLHENEKDLDRWLIETLFSPIKDREDKKSQ